ncbi:MAG: hypothetical protein Q8R07_00010, partial [Candidatus Uhrbacteria bacterium]|nr:hypothetical protein [Candidatus Uhrbacteria bacterium]
MKMPGEKPPIPTPPAEQEPGEWQIYRPPSPLQVKIREIPWGSIPGSQIVVTIDGLAGWEAFGGRRDVYFEAVREILRDHKMEEGDSGYRLWNNLGRDGTADLVTGTNYAKTPLLTQWLTPAAIEQRANQLSQQKNLTPVDALPLETRLRFSTVTEKARLLMNLYQYGKNF